MGANQYRIPGPNKTLYEGECNEEGKPHGKGRMKYGEDCTFEGIFSNGAPLKGKLRYWNGDHYEGEVKNNKPSGQGVWVDSVGTYRGTFNNGDFIHGDIIYTDGSRYTGYIVDGKKHGVHGEYIFKDGDKFVV